MNNKYYFFLIFSITTHLYSMSPMELTPEQTTTNKRYNTRAPKISTSQAARLLLRLRRNKPKAIPKRDSSFNAREYYKEGKNNYFCIICPYVSRSRQRSHIIQHVCGHFAQPTHECKHCLMSTVYRVQMIRHISKNHHDKVDYKPNKRGQMRGDWVNHYVNIPR